MAYGSIRGEDVPKPKKVTSPLQNAYGAAIDENASNYDDIYKNYDDILNSAKNSSNSKLNYVPINSVFTRNIQGQNYQRSGDLNSAMSGLEEYGRTGGYSEGDIGNIRERAISPIRSIYSSAQEGLRRNKVLQGGYAPNFGAVTSKMARESAGQIGDITTGVNAEIAKMVASGKLSGLQSMGNLAANENNQINSINARNTESANEVERWNASEQARVNDINNQMKLAFEKMNTDNANTNTNTQLNAVQGKQSLYGTTPALTQTFANQVLANNSQNMQAAQTANMIKNQRANIGLNLVNSQLKPQAGRG